MKLGRRLLAASVACAAALLAANAWAGDPDRAEALFQEGMTLHTDGNRAAACDRFAESVREEVSVGALGRLAVCHEQEGKLATAQRTWQRALEAAERSGDADRADTARHMLARLVPRVPTLTLRPATGKLVPRHAEVFVDGGRWEPSIVGRPQPQDPGSYRITLRARGHRSWQTTVTLAPGDRKRVALPALEPTRLPAPAPPPADDTRGMRTAGIVLIVVGAGAAVAGGAMGGVVLSRRDAAAAEGCDADRRCDEHALETIDELGPLADAATGMIVAGVLTAAAGVTLFAVGALRSPEAPLGTARARLAVDPVGARLRLRF
jgi:hypothetical protein